MSKRKKFYAVAVGQNQGIYETWEECSAQVTGFPAAKYKGFSTREQAQQFLDATSHVGASQRTSVGGSLKRKRDRNDGDADGEDGHGSGLPRASSTRGRQTKLITSPYFTTTPVTDAASEADDASRETKRLRSAHSSTAQQSKAGRSTSLVKFFEENNLQTKKWIDKDWIVANWK